MALPFGLGIAVSVGLYKLQDDPNVPFSSFMLFLGVALAITAFPVLARILAELKLLRTKVGAITMAAGLLNDCTAWVLLALVVALLNSSGGLEALYVFLTTVAFALFLIVFIRPVYRRLCVMTGSFENGPSPFLMTVTLMMVLISAFVTDIIGVHPIFGGFLAGVIVPHEGDLATKITEKTEDMVNIIFLPLYFTLSGLKTQIGLLDTGTVWGYVICVIVVACFGKISGCTLASKACGMTLRESFAIGFLMNCKGLVELIVLNIGHDAGVLNDQIFVIMVVMALITTFMTTPMVMWLYPEWYQKQRAEATRGTLAASLRVSTTGKEPSFHFDKTNGPDRFCMVTMLNRLEVVPSMMSLFRLLHQSPTKGDPGTSVLEIHALRLLELTQRASDVMKIRDQRETQRYDPVLNVIRTFGSLLGIDALHTRLEFLMPSDYIKTLADHGENVQADLILLPWVAERPIPLADDDQLIENASGFPINNDAMTTANAFSIPHLTIGLFIDRGLGLGLDEEPTLSRLQVCVPFCGGQDDRAALLLALRLQVYQNTDLTVMRLLRTLDGAASGISYASQQSIMDTLRDTRDVDDDVFIDTLFTLTSSENTGVRCITLSYSSLEQAVNTVTSECHAIHLGKQDLLIAGRHQPAFSPRTPDVRTLISASDQIQYKELRSVVGPLVYSLLLSDVKASVVVIQAPSASDTEQRSPF
ncbi:Sodium/hydrogen exchanger family-domain-containing protein [Syncephalastrum racemosum]|uniref:Sodium/hydrogen exchanger family-domain-containing protein n=1 Tax=Syncephalastrum racemosum TaxID=13706 RepID=A0A1X2HI50_SYNRA|nr:Sodium/hydrogen exchanger family-domain-containing protein [Syncephalastrum racemosum]